MSTTEMPVLYFTRPQSLRALMAVCKAHPEVKVTRLDSIASGNCGNGTNAFARKYLGDRSEVSLPELVPFIHSNHRYWSRIMDTIQLVLLRHQLVADDWRWFQDETAIHAPSRRRTVLIRDAILRS